MSAHRAEMFCPPNYFFGIIMLNLFCFFHKVILKRVILNTEANFQYDNFKSGTGAEEEENRQYALAIAKCRQVHTNTNKILLRIKEEVAKTKTGQRPTERSSHNSRGSKQG